jgi:hypothetical protein
MNFTSRNWGRLAAAAAACGTILLPSMALAARDHAPSSAHRTAHVAAAPFCETPGLVIWLNTNGNGTAGSVFYNLQFTNLSGHACTLNGFPFIHAIGLSGQATGRRAGFSSATPRVVTLNEGATAKAVLQLVDVGNFPPSQCKPTTAAGFEVFPPNQTRARIVPFPFGACSNKNGPVFMRVAPVTK